VREGERVPQLQRPAPGAGTSPAPRRPADGPAPRPGRRRPLSWRSARRATPRRPPPTARARRRSTRRSAGGGGRRGRVRGQQERGVDGSGSLAKGPHGDDRRVQPAGSAAWPAARQWASGARSAQLGMPSTHAAAQAGGVGARCSPLVPNASRRLTGRLTCRSAALLAPHRALEKEQAEASVVGQDLADARAALARSEVRRGGRTGRGTRQPRRRATTARGGRMACTGSGTGRVGFLQIAPRRWPAARRGGALPVSASAAALLQAALSLLSLRHRRALTR
jgi:hypothetical protein